MSIKTVSVTFDDGGVVTVSNNICLIAPADGKKESDYEFVKENIKDVFCLDEEVCSVPGCFLPCEYEGWYRVKDGMGFETGLIRRTSVCENHQHLLMSHAG